ncbi:hypothetical protein B0P06_005873 [Clostridium saccharoperbutylacetonicum]|uniref:hypothetical protein n=1 Tax=Clostridium saccharoperbutylacetonicum TaxID=36745 RepID=UPI00037070A2|nr:hypothetical protein [Clostridium saccharoperbutylacetonicum]NRT63388.1 hypothetical protein [Clostridium saccharoperbutylacetonicum]NSB26750.1 hypothetical protein [Clostridium saccharoperbutylacetonicum]NSB46102.1 hypothetical protein [Clostridium saccharoperbutylacetonicum]
MLEWFQDIRYSSKVITDDDVSRIKHFTASTIEVKLQVGETYVLNVYSKIGGTETYTLRIVNHIELWM